MRPRPCALLAWLLALAACASAPVRRFPLAAPLASDDDTVPQARPPARPTESELWDFVDQSVFARTTESLLIQLPRESADVNALDEVPDSSWFADRALESLSPEQVRRGACTEASPETALPWTIIAAKPNGVNPGFVVRTATGAKYLLKADGTEQPERATTADVVGAVLYHALGYFVPCNRIVAVDRTSLRVAPDAAAAPGRPVTPATLERVLAFSTRRPDGRYRMSASLFLEGDPLGPFAYQGVRPDDLNDAVPHEDRRELRGMRVLAAWLNHFDVRAQNTFTTWMPAPGGGGHVRHWIIDFGDSFGAPWAFGTVSPRAGQTYSLDAEQIGEDTVTLGLLHRPWERALPAAEAPIFGYYSGRDFEPDAWRPVAPNPAFLRMTERDAAWMARRIARLDAPRITAAVAAAELSNPQWSRYLLRTLLERRRQILERYLTHLAPLADASIEAGERLCATDLAAQTGVRPAGGYRALRYDGVELDRETALAVQSRDARVCAVLGGHRAPDGGLRDGDRARYVVVDLTAPNATRAPLRVHLYDLGPTRGFRLVGLERPRGHGPPRG